MVRLSVILIVALLGHAATAGVLERVAETKTFRLGYRTDAPPFSSEAEPGKRKGYSLDICRAVGDEIRAELKLPALVIQYVAVGAENRFDKLEAGDIDILCGPTTATLSRRERVDFSLPIFVDGAGLLVADAAAVQNLDDVATLRLGVRAGTTTETALHNTFPGANLRTMRDHHDGIEALLKGEIDVYFADRTLLVTLRDTVPGADTLQIAEEYLTVEPYALALPKGDSRFRLLVDRTISGLYLSGGIDAIADDAFGSNRLSKLVRALYRITPLPN
ncbi:MAG: amino acid ABC transporter substrate-binding protein [Alphaproteobacteria bacterium]|nr:amino acid ABC transporter substrate-binding protein [Alphaproteobacteria bacterium]MCB9930856.1 amino acid ABC transporter substrate-binding protein [Alphaproteobacteria bacterium]